MRDRTKASFTHSKDESIYNNGKQNKRNPMDEKSKKIKRQIVRNDCFEQCMDNNASTIVDYNLLPRVNK